MYPISTDVDLKNAAAVVYEKSMQRMMQKKCEYVLGDVDSFFLCYEKKLSDNSLYRNMRGAEITGQRGENSAME